MRRTGREMPMTLVMKITNIEISFRWAAARLSRQSPESRLVKKSVGQAVVVAAAAVAMDGG